MEISQDSPIRVVFPHQNIHPIILWEKLYKGLFLVDIFMINWNFIA